MSNFSALLLRAARVLAIVLLAAMLPLASVQAEKPGAGACLPVVRDGWVRLPPGRMPMMAGFGRIENTCDAPVSIVSASSASFADVELHETTLVDGVSRMRHVPELRIAPGQAAVFKPGGLHLMLMRPQAALPPGSTITMTFTLADGRTLVGEFELRKAGS